MLTVKNIKMSYEGEHLLRDVSFTVNPEEVVCLLGASGSGKSTLLRIIAGLVDPEDGDVLWDGKSLTGVPTHERRFGLMFQDYALFPHRNVAENIAFGLRMQNQSKQDVQKRVLEALKTIDMPGFANRKVTELSGGEQQRVALARALAPQPRLLMLDEPLGALDRNLREQLSHELRRILHEQNSCDLRHPRSGRSLCHCRSALAAAQWSSCRVANRRSSTTIPCNALGCILFGLGILSGQGCRAFSAES